MKSVRFYELQIILDMISIMGSSFICGVSLMDNEPLDGMIWICVAVAFAAFCHVVFVVDALVNFLREKHRADVFRG